jgi:hypothetical protein
MIPTSAGLHAIKIIKACTSIIRKYVPSGPRKSCYGNSYHFMNDKWDNFYVPVFDCLNHIFFLIHVLSSNTSKGRIWIHNIVFYNRRVVILTNRYMYTVLIVANLSLSRRFSFRSAASFSRSACHTWKLFLKSCLKKPVMESHSRETRSRN